MSGTTGYTILGWVVWQVAKRVLRRKVEENRPKLIAAGVVAAVVVVGIAAAKAGEEG
jgi:hypothetical protein